METSINKRIKNNDDIKKIAEKIQEDCSFEDVTILNFIEY